MTEYKERLDCRCFARVMSPLFLLSPCSITSWCSYTVAMFETIAGYDSVGYLWIHVSASVHGVLIVVAGCGRYGPHNLALRASLGYVCRELTLRMIFVSPLSCCSRQVCTASCRTKLEHRALAVGYTDPSSFLFQRGSHFGATPPLKPSELIGYRNCYARLRWTGFGLRANIVEKSLRPQRLRLVSCPFGLDRIRPPS